MHIRVCFAPKRAFQGRFHALKEPPVHRDVQKGLPLLEEEPSGEDEGEDDDESPVGQEVGDGEDLSHVSALLQGFLSRFEAARWCEGASRCLYDSPRASTMRSE